MLMVISVVLAILLYYLMRHVLWVTIIPVVYRIIGRDLSIIHYRMMYDVSYIFTSVTLFLISSLGWIIFTGLFKVPLTLSCAMLAWSGYLWNSLRK